MKREFQVQKILNWLYTSSVRNVLRKCGVINIFKFINNLQTLNLYFEYERNHPKFFQTQIGNHEASFLIADKKEYARAASVNKDKYIIQILVNNIKPGDCFWDIGASVGFYTAFVAKAVGENGKVIAFEPEVKSFSRLLQNIENNKLKNVYPYKVALGNAHTQKKLAISGHYSSGAHSLIAHNKEKSRNVEYEEVEVFRGDDFLLQQNIDSPTAIKIDVEGAEEEVLMGLSNILKNKKCILVVCEVHFSILESSDRGDTPKKIQRFLNDNDFTKQQWLDHSHLAALKE
ncbi:MAG: hypothetical protein A3I68_06205 [Candidatus Melainabacteria bacterium RIFCSPLOWO2_02_FULL_35_15]|nr:MAG: hypothetical protein A3F80_08210 [Candidatus Melainabacteria bacterium RIFCSPLOWO2_12_FULL_35_11]OGI14558.1 MAG: hypothetical protein A3I68_06205 [Candidatus Melainabacteria bacterium RIFCSPLOWO2_02_FULL_35_15]